MRRPAVTAALMLLAVLLPVGMAGCSSTAGTPGAGGSKSAPGTAGSPHPAAGGISATGSGPVNVLYAGSLVDLMSNQLGPGFDAATGYTFTGFSAGSTALATQIKGQVHQGDVFVSASPAVNASLQGAANGDWVGWYATFATSPLVLGYNPKSSYASQLKSKPWDQVVTEPGFLLGSTDPATDPKGKLAVKALQQAAAHAQDPANAAKLAALAADEGIVYPEETLVARLQSGQLDAGFFYSAEAVAAGIPTVPLTGQQLGATYTVTVLNRAPHEAAAEAFVSYLLGPQGQEILRKDGFEVASPPAVSGSGGPASLRGLLPGS